MAVKRRKNAKRVHDNPNQKVEHSTNSGRRYCLYLTVVLLSVTVVVYTFTTSADPHTAESLKRLPSKNLIEMLRRYSYMGDSTALKHLINDHPRLNWTHVQYHAPPTASPLHLALQGRHDSISQSSASLRGDHEVSVSLCMQ